MYSSSIHVQTTSAFATCAEQGDVDEGAGDDGRVSAAAFGGGKRDERFLTFLSPFFFPPTLPAPVILSINLFTSNGSPSCARIGSPRPVAMAPLSESA